MIDLYFWTTPNGYKPLLFLEEAGIEYELRPVNISKGEQFEPAFLKISPNNRIPAIVDHNPEDGGAPLAQFESGAILIYLAEKSGQFLPTRLQERSRVITWLFWQVSGLGLMAGQAHHFRAFAPEPVPYGIERYTQEVNRLYGVMEQQLSDSAYLAGDTRSPTLPVGPGSCHTNAKDRT